MTGRVVSVALRRVTVGVADRVDEVGVGAGTRNVRPVVVVLVEGGLTIGHDHGEVLTAYQIDRRGVAVVVVESEAVLAGVVAADVDERLGERREGAVAIEHVLREVLHLAEQRGLVGAGDAHAHFGTAIARVEDRETQAHGGRETAVAIVRVEVVDQAGHGVARHLDPRGARVGVPHRDRVVEQDHHVRRHVARREQVEVAHHVDGSGRKREQTRREGEAEGASDGMGHQ